jgi:hypothetical protein
MKSANLSTQLSLNSGSHRTTPGNAQAQKSGGILFFDCCCNMNGLFMPIPQAKFTGKRKGARLEN